jgi:ubiquinone/menaquinone biosynthesis C-methylase UbiE
MQSTENLLEILKHKFAIERLPSYNTPSGSYFWYRKRQEVFKLVERNLHIFQNQSNQKSASPVWVDIGCGESIDLFFIRELFEKHSLKWNFIGLEANPSLLNINSLKKQYYQIDNVDFIPCDVTQKLPFQDGEVEIIYCSEVIEHLLNPESFLQEIKRVTKPHGYLLLTTPNEPNVFQRSYWSRNRFQKMQATMQAIKEQPQQVDVDTEKVLVYDGHVSLRTISQWDKTLNQIGYRVVDYGRGAVAYGGTPFFDNEWILGTRFLLEAFLDRLPRQWSRNLSDELIGLYQLDDKSH